MGRSVEVLETIELLYRAAVEPELWPDALHQLALAVGAMGTVMIPITPGDPTGVVVSPDLREAKEAYETGWWRYDTRVSRIHSRKLSGGVCSEQQLFTDSEIRRDVLRQEFCAPYGMGSFAAHLVSPVPGQVVSFSVARALGDGYFQKHELETLDVLGRHAARALIVSIKLHAAAGLERTLAEALERLDCGALVVDHGLAVLQANEAAAAILGDGLALVQGVLQASSRQDQAQLDQLMRSALAVTPEIANLSPVALRRPSGRRPLIVQAIPVARQTSGGIFPQAAAALVIVIDTDRAHRNNLAEALRLLGLTPAQARLASLIGEGHSRADAAEALAVSQSTVNDTVKQIYSKLGISRQSELVRLVARLAILKH